VFLQQLNIVIFRKSENEKILQAVVLNQN
jgi:hypothetical protein